MKTKRQEIINAAIALISKQGYKATTMRQISKECGIKTGGLYHYIDSKEQIILEIQTTFMDSILETIKQNSSQPSAQKKLERALRSIADIIAHNHKAWKIIYAEIDFFPPSKREKILRKSQDLEIAIEEIINEGKRTGELRQVNSKIVTSSILGAFNNISQWSEDSINADEIGKALSSFLLYGLADQEYRPAATTGELIPTWA